MDFRILGPLEVYTGNGLVPIRGAKPRALLAVLLLHANEVVSNDRLIDALWGEDPPETALKALQVHLSKVRKTIGASSIATRPRGYVLEVAPGDLDLHRFEQLHAEARALLTDDPAQAGRLLASALALWRGPPLADLTRSAFAQAAVGRLEELRIAALEDQIAAELAVGRHAAVIGTLDALIAEHPLREALRGQLMVALYRSGRQADALDVYRDARAALTEELGIEPSRDLRELQQTILNQSPELDFRPAERSVREERARGDFVGRESELDALVAALEDAIAGHGRLVLLSGEPGIGKSRLAEELMARARSRGARVIVGRCWEAGGAPAYWPWTQSLRAFVSQADPDQLRRSLGVGAGDLAQLLPELHELLGDLPEPLAGSEGARFRLFEAASSFVLGIANADPLVIVLDDLHAADEPSLLLLRFVARAMGDSRLLIVCAFRDVDPTLQPPLVSALAELVREGQTRQISLDGLDQPEVAAYIELSTGVASASLAQAVRSETEGNPLFVSELVRLLQAEGRISDGDASLRIPPGVRAVITQRVGRLSEPCGSMLAQAAVLGREFGLDPLARLVGLPQAQVLELLDEAVAERIVGDAPGSSGRLRFAHALIRDTLYESLTSARKLELHRAAGEALEAAYSADLDPHLAELAHHFVCAAPAQLVDKAVDYSRRAGDRAVAQLAYEEAVRLYGMGLDLAGDGGARCGLLLARGEAQARAGNTPAAKETYRSAAELASRLGLAEELARAALGYGGRLIWEVSRDDEYVVPLMEAALAAIGHEDSSVRATLLARLAAGPLRDPRYPRERQISLAREALEMARRLGDPGTLVYALDGYIPAVESPANTAEMLELATELLEIAAELGDKERVIEAHEHRLGRLIELGRVNEARTEVELMARLAEELRQPPQQWLADVCAARLALLEGRFDDAERLIPHALSLGERAQSWNATVAFRLQRYLLRREQGRLAEVSEVVRHGVEEFPTYPVWRCAWSQVSAELGLTREARETFDRVVDVELPAMAFAEMWLVSMGFLAETAAALEDATRSAILYEQLLPYADRVAVTYPEISTGSVARYLGLLAAAGTHWSDAERHYEDALAMHERLGARPWLALTQRNYAQMLFRRNAAGDEAKAKLFLSHAASTDRDLNSRSGS